MDKLEFNKKKASGFPWLRVSFFIGACGFVILAAGPLPEKIWRKWQGPEKPPLVKPPEKKGAAPVGAPLPKPPVQPPAKPPVKNPVAPVVKTPTDHTASSGADIRKMSRGFKLKTKVTVLKGDIASKARKIDSSYTATYELKITLPKPSTTLKTLEKVSPQLSRILPAMKEMLPKAKVSPFFYQAYDNKVKRLKLKSTQLNDLMTRHNFYDCETILNLKHPKTGRRALLLQSEMDVVSDGSDGDRLPKMPAKIVNSSYYQPMTSYGWRKTGKTPNPLIAGWNGRIKKANEEIARSGTSTDRKAWLRMRIKKIKREIQDMEARSYLIAEYDPFIVMPINMVTSKGDKYAAHVGDYAVVIYKGKIYPTIVGDAGPSFKTGEGSLRIAKQLNSRAGIYSRPVSDLTVTYLIFPGTADKKFKAPDYEAWHQRCSKLLAEFGGLGKNVTLYKWKNTLPKIQPKVDPKNDQKNKPKNKNSKDKASQSNPKEGKGGKGSADSKTPAKEKAEKSPSGITPQKKDGKEKLDLPPGVTADPSS